MTIVTGPREWGKSTCGSLVLPLHCILHPYKVYRDGNEVDAAKRYIRFISAAEPASKKHLGALCYELEENELIRRDYGDLYRDPDRSPTDRVREWSKTAAVTTNGFRLEAHGRNARQRGMKWKQFRPRLDVYDDLEDEASVRQQGRRNADFQWITRTMIPGICSDFGNGLILGTTSLHPDQMLCRLIKHGQKHNWNICVVEATHTDAAGNLVSNWPERYSKEWCVERRDDMGDAAFDAEYNQNPDAIGTELSASSFKYYEYSQIADTVGSMAVFIGVDPAFRETERSDNTALVPIAYDAASHKTYVLPAIVAKLDMAKKVDEILAMYARWNATRIGVETDGQQSAFKDSLDDKAKTQGITLPSEGVSQPRGISKRERIQSRLFRSVADGTLVFLREDTSHITIRDELLHLWTTAHDDGADALEIACRMRDAYLIDMHKRTGKARACILSAHTPKGSSALVRDSRGRIIVAS
jgi:hypothetical protein